LTSPRPYDICLSEDTLDRIVAYKRDIETGRMQPGARLARRLPAATTEQFIEALLATKQPRIFAESEIFCDGTDWMPRELALLGDINVAMKVQVFDNGTWSPGDKAFKAYDPPLDAALLFTPGPLLGTGAGFLGLSPDYMEVAAAGVIDQEKYNALMERRLLPLLHYANSTAATEGKPALVTLPGIGAGAFAGPFKGEMGGHLDLALRYILQKHGAALPHIGAVCFDPFNEGADADATYHGIAYRVRPAALHPGRPQLSAPVDWQEQGDDFSNYGLYKIVAWDHASLPGNDFFGGSRFTDDGVAAAATNAMEVVTGVAGNYRRGAYLPPAEHANWESVAHQANTRLQACGNVHVAMKEGSYRPLTPPPTSPPKNGPKP